MELAKQIMANYRLQNKIIRISLDIHGSHETQAVPIKCCIFSRLQKKKVVGKVVMALNKLGIAWWFLKMN